MSHFLQFTRIFLPNLKYCKYRVIIVSKPKYYVNQKKDIAQGWSQLCISGTNKGRCQDCHPLYCWEEGQAEERPPWLPQLATGVGGDSFPGKQKFSVLFAPGGCGLTWWELPRGGHRPAHEGGRSQADFTMPSLLRRPLLCAAQPLWNWWMDSWIEGFQGEGNHHSRLLWLPCSGYQQVQT